MSTKKSILFIVNPISGGIKLTNINESISQHIDHQRFNWKVFETQKGGDATLKANKEKSNYDIICAIGGDGTINEVAQCLIGTQTAFAVIPKGSGNGFSNHFKIPKNMGGAIEIINRHQSKTIDTGLLDGKPFLSVAGIGFDAVVAKAFDTFGTRGYLSYIRLTIKHYISYKPQVYHIKTDTSTFTERALLITIANSSQFGNDITIAPTAEISDGRLKLVLLKPFRWWQIPALFISLKRNKIHQSKHCKTMDVKNLTIESEDRIAHLDGEPTNIGATTSISVRASSLKMIC